MWPGATSTKVPHLLPILKKESLIASFEVGRWVGSEAFSLHIASCVHKYKVPVQSSCWNIIL